MRGSGRNGNGRNGNGRNGSGRNGNRRKQAVGSRSARTDALAHGGGAKGSKVAVGRDARTGERGRTVGRRGNGGGSVPCRWRRCRERLKDGRRFDAAGAMVRIFVGVLVRVGGNSER